MSEHIYEDSDIEHERYHVIPFGSMREEIVRCRDCKHYTEDEAEYWHYCGEWCGQVEPDGFCAWSCRRSDKE